MRIVGLEKCVVRIQIQRPDGTTLLAAAVFMGGIWTWESPDGTQRLQVACGFEDRLLDLAHRAGVSDDLKMADADAMLPGRDE